jgi:hypothetical protein
MLGIVNREAPLPLARLIDAFLRVVFVETPPGAPTKY